MQKNKAKSFIGAEYLEKQATTSETNVGVKFWCIFNVTVEYQDLYRNKDDLEKQKIFDLKDVIFYICKMYKLQNERFIIKV